MYLSGSIEEVPGKRSSDVLTNLVLEVDALEAGDIDQYCDGVSEDLLFVWSFGFELIYPNNNFIQNLEGML